MMLRLEGVSKSFGGVDAAANVNIEVPAGKITGLIGPNGAGKTTIVNLITGMLKLTAGRIMLGDKDISEAEADQVSRAGISRTFQNIRLLPEQTVLDNVVIGFHRHEQAGIWPSILGLPAARAESRDMRERGRALLERFHLTRFSDHPAGALAYGHQRRVEMARAVASNPDVLLLDEPVAGMNDVEANELGVIFRELANGGMALLLIEHNIRFVTRMCEHVYVLDTGRIISTGTADHVMHDPAVVAAYIGGGAK